METVTSDNLSRLVDFDSPFRVNTDGTLSDVPHVYAPEVWHVDGEREPEGPGDDWEYVDGYSGQDRYSGPVMHASEQLGGGMARDVLDCPGVYVLCVVEVMPDDEDPEPEPAGWVLLRRTRSRMEHLRTGDVFLYPHSTEENVVEVLRDPEPTTDRFGRPMLHAWCTIRGTDREGWVMFGPTGAAPVTLTTTEDR